jgi:hypothetical protein
MTMERKGDNVTFVREDTAGTEGGGTYEGTVSGLSASGNGTLTPPHRPKLHGTWTAKFFMEANPTPTAGPPPLKIVECEGKVCSPDAAGSPVWIFLKPNFGTGSYATSDPGLTIEHLDHDFIAVRRTDLSGCAKGLRAIYMGKIAGQQITGSVIYYEHGNLEAPRTDAWHGFIDSGGPGLQPTDTSARTSFFSNPLTLIECEGNACIRPETPYSTIWQFTGPQGNGWVGQSEKSVVLEHLDDRMIAVRRKDSDASGGLTALYFGEIDGKRITGATLFYDRDHPSVPRTDTWFGMIQDSGDLKAAAAAGVPVETIPDGEQDKFCGSAATVEAMQEVENKAVEDPNGEALRQMACSVGVCSSEQEKPTALAGKKGSDRGESAAKDRGSFVCVGLFLRGPVELQKGSSELTDAAVDALLKTHPAFKEWFKVKPLGDHHYRLELLPSSLQLARTYATEMIYP